MQVHAPSYIHAFAAALCFPLLVTATLRLPRGLSAGHVTSSSSLVPHLARSIDSYPSANVSSCRYLPGDSAYPTTTDWNALNKTVGGRLIRGTPLAEVCYGIHAQVEKCSLLQQEWPTVDPYLDHPVNFMAPYWQNDSCTPFGGLNGSCSLGNMAQYAINVSSAHEVIAGLEFAKKKNIRLTIKNTGHDLLGRSSGEGSLALWTHHLKDVSFLNYTSLSYTGPAAKLGAGIQVHEAYEAASLHGLRVVAGGCPTVGLAGWLPGGGHGPLTSAYGLGADEVLEFEVVTTDGKHFTTSPTQTPDLFWALAGGGSGNYAVILSITVRAHIDGPVAGTKFIFTNTDDDAYWAAVLAWVKHLLVLDTLYPSLKTAVTFTSSFFYLDFATFPDATVAELQDALNPFYQELETLGLTLSVNETSLQPNYLEHYNYFSGTAPWGVNQTVGNRLIPRSLAQQRPDDLVGTIRDIAGNYSAAVFVFVAANVTHARVGNQPGENAVNPAWRDALLLLNFGMELTPDAAWPEINTHQTIVNQWQNAFSALTPAGGSYLNEGTFDDLEWKWDYFGENYGKLEAIKAKYDPDALLWVNTGVGNDLVWTVGDDGRMCRKT